MSTPASPITTTTTPSKLSVLLDPLHIFLTLIVIGALLVGVYLFESKRAEIAEAKAEAATQVLKVAQDAAVSSAVQNALQQKQSEAVEQAMSAANQQLITANQQLQSSNALLAAKLSSQQKTDAVLPPSSQAQRWSVLVPAAQVAPTATGFTVDAAGGLATIQALEEIPVDRNQIANLSLEVSNAQQEATNFELSLKAEQASHQSDLDNDKKQLVASQDDIKKVQADFTAYKKKSRKNLIKAFFIGAAVGFFGGHAIGF